MFSKTGMTLVCAAVLAWSAALASAETLEEIIGAVEKQGATIRTMTCATKMDMDVMGQKVSMTGEMVMVPPRKMFMKSVTHVTAQGRRSDVQMKIVSDGEVMWQEVNAGGQVQVNRVNLVAAGVSPQDLGMGPGAPGAANPAKALQDLKAMMDVKVLDDATLPDGQKAWVIEGKLKPGMAGMMPGAEGAGAEAQKALINGLRMFVGQKDHVINRMEFLSSEGATTGTMSFEDVRINAEVDDKVFAYTPPEGAPVTDLTEMMKKQRAAMAGAKKPEEPEAETERAAPADAPPAKTLKAGAPAPAFVVKTLDGETLDLAKLRGKPVLVFFWASWHAGSVAMLAEADALAKKSKGLELIGISLDEPGAVGAVKKLVADKNIAAKVALGTGEIFDAWWVSRVPTYALVDAEGRVIISEAEPKNLDALKKALEGALGK